MTTIGTRLSENALEAAVVAGRTRIQRSRAVPPVRFVQPRAGSHAALVFTSALGGGMLEGDDYRFELECREKSTLMFAPQSNTRIFPCPDGGVTRQTVRGTVYANGLAVCGGDPVVLYQDSRFSQSQHWTVHPGGRLVLVDWMTAGRLSRGEDFAFSAFESETRVQDANNRLLLVDTMRLERPAEEAKSAEGTEDAEGADEDPARAGMGDYSSHLVIHVLGPGWETLHGALDARLRAAGAEGRPAWMDGVRLAGLGVREGRGFSLRALGRDRAALEPIVGLLFEQLARPEWLGFDFWARKY